MAGAAGGTLLPRRRPPGAGSPPPPPPPSGGAGADPEHVAGTACRAARSGAHDLDGEAGMAEAAGELLVLAGRPDAEDPARPQRPARGGKAAQIVEASVAGPGQAVGAVVD